MPRTFLRTSSVTKSWGSFSAAWLYFTMVLSSSSAASATTTSTASKNNLVRSDSKSSSNQNQHNIVVAPADPSSESSLAAAATASLQLLLREDRLLVQHELHLLNKPEQAVFNYASELLQQQSSSGTSSTEARATLALEDVNRKLALVESLAERVSRNSPQAVAGPLLRLHGYNLQPEDEQESEDKDVAGNNSSSHSGSSDNNSSSYPTASTTANTLMATRERCHRLSRQGKVLEGVAKRVESSLERGLTRMTKATSRLSRVLELNLVLKQILRLQFESSKLEGYDLDDLRDLTRVAASVAIMQDLTNNTPQLKDCKIDVVEQMRPHANKVSFEVRKAASSLLSQHHERGSGAVVMQLGATLQVYYHLGELPQAAWSAVQHGLDAANEHTQNLFSSSSISKLQEQATAQAKAAVGKSHNPGDTERLIKKKLREVRAQASNAWAAGVMDAALQVWNLHFVLCRKSDPTSRKLFANVVSSAPIPAQYKECYNDKDEDFSIFSIFWKKYCLDLGHTLQQLFEENHGKKLEGDVAGLYPAVRAASLEMLSSLHDTMQAGSSTLLEDAAASQTTSGVLGGSAGLDDAFLNTHLSQEESSSTMTLGVASADTWTRAADAPVSTKKSSSSFAATTLSLSSIFQSPEWKALQGSSSDDDCGLYPLQQAFVKASSDRLCEPLQYMFPSGIAVDEDGVAISVLPTLPSRYDLQNLSRSISLELSIADPKEGGGELTMTPIIAENIVKMVTDFLERAKTVVSGAGEQGCLENNKIVPTSDLIHDLKVSNVMSALATALRTAPENTFVVPYRPATLVQHEEAANMCQTALVPALLEIENMVKTLILNPLCHALNRRVANAIAKVHHGPYLSSSTQAPLSDGGGGTSFVEKNLKDLYEGICNNILSKLPAEYASVVASTVATYSVYNFCSNIALIRPLSETARLHITQDLADFELALEQLVFKGNSSMTLSQMTPYAELRAVRQMLFWNGLEQDAEASPASLTKTLLREVWIKDVRPSTVIHFLFSFAPPLLSSPHLAKRQSPEEYVTTTLVQWDGSFDDGEASAWMVAMECCDSYQQRESVASSKGVGDARVAALLMSLGPEILRRRRH